MKKFRIVDSKNWIRRKSLVIGPLFVVLSIIVSFILISYNNFLIDAFLVAMFFAGLLSPIWAYRHILLKHKVKTLVIGIILFILGFVSYGFTYGLSGTLIFPVIYKFAGLIKDCTWPLCNPREGLYLSGVFYASIGLYLIILFYKKEMVQRGWKK